MWFWRKKYFRKVNTQIEDSVCVFFVDGRGKRIMRRIKYSRNTDNTHFEI